VYILSYGVIIIAMGVMIIALGVIIIAFGMMIIEMGVMIIAYAQNFLPNINKNTKILDMFDTLESIY